MEVCAPAGASIAKDARTAVNVAERAIKLERRNDWTDGNTKKLLSEAWWMGLRLNAQQRTKMVSEKIIVRYAQKGAYGLKYMMKVLP